MYTFWTFLRLYRVNGSQEIILEADHDLLKRIRRLDRRAFKEVFDLHYDGLYRFIYRMVHNGPQAEDLAAEVFSRLVEAVTEERGPTHNLKAWLYRVAHNLAVDDLRRTTDHLPLHEELVATADSSVARQVHQSILRDQVHSALNMLTTKQRAVIVLKFLEGYSNSEIAEVLEITPRGVLKLQQRGLAALRTQMLTFGAVMEMPT
jgi:RNA polymerase sigma-70 factor (ECF subfamily)